MFYEIVDLQRFSGPGCTIYSVIPKGSTKTLFDEFLEEQSEQNEAEVRDLVSGLLEIGKSHGMREHFYKPHEGRLGDNICALYNKPGGRLRLYFIKYGTDVIIIGGGGYKPPGIRAWQDDAVLNNKMIQLMAYADHIGKRIEEGYDLGWSEDLRNLEGDLKNYADEQEE